MESIIVLLLITFSLTVAAPPSVTKRYRTDYVYNRNTDAFYKLHPELKWRREMISTCMVEGASALVVTSDQDLVQVHAMMKKFPDLGEWVWVAGDGQIHESAEEQPIIDMDTTSNEIDYTHNCDVVTRGGAVKSTFCSQRLPFMCKVDAKNASYNEHCGVYGRAYKYFASVSSCYKVPQAAYNWNEAYAECQAEGAHLVVINSETEREVVHNFTNTEPKVVGSLADWFLFAGFRAEKTTGNTPRVFKTVTNQTLEAAGYAQWMEHEPNNAGGKEYCGVFFKNNGELNDVDCTNKYGFICEKEVRQT